MKTYSHILQGSDATLENAIGHAQGLDWSEIELSEGVERSTDISYQETVNGIDIYYNVVANYYLFAQPEDDGKGGST